MNLYNFETRLMLARRALIADGYFSENAIRDDDDIAACITELANHLRRRIDELEAQQQPDPEDKPRGCDIEILERTHADHFDNGYGAIVPNAVRINGVPTLVSDTPITVHELSGQDVVQVTLTVLARSVHIGAEAIGEPAEAGKP